MNTELPRFLRLQSILYNTDVQSLRKSFACITNAIAFAKQHEHLIGAEVAYGDCSPAPLFTQEALKQWQSEEASASDVRIEYTFFGENKGSAGGHNFLMDLARKQTQGTHSNSLLVFMNPDVKMMGDTISSLLQTLKRPSVGLVEARQLPIEHPKAYDENTGRTLWASTATAMTTTDIFWEVGGFDAEAFFLYCDDVDFSWKIRERGSDVVFQPSAVIFHDKRLNRDGSWPASEAERYYSAEAALFLSHKWSRNDKTEEYLRYFDTSPDELQKRAAEAYRKRQRDGKLPEPRDSNHRIGVFTGAGYGPNRF